MLSRVDSPVGLNELLALAGLPESETLRLIYVLALGGLLHRESWPVVFTAEEISKARSVKAAAPDAAPAELKAEEKSEPESKPTPAPVEERDEKEEINDLFARLEMATNYYQILGVVRPAKDADIKRAYHALAKRFHPDRFRRNEDKTLHARIESAFARIAQAYETLKDRTSRATYDSTLLKQDAAMRAVKRTSTEDQSRAGSVQETQRSSSEDSSRARPSQTVTPPIAYQAEEKFKQGMAALKSGNNSAALACLGEAARLVPTQPRYRAHYGQALSGSERMRRNAEAEIKAAISLDAKNPLYRVMLAELYLQIGLPRRAQGELAHALSIDPQHKDARRLFDKLKGNN